MLSNRSLLQRSACAACRLHQNIAAKQLARSGKWTTLALPLRLAQQQSQRSFSAGSTLQYRSKRGGAAKKTVAPAAAEEGQNGQNQRKGKGGRGAKGKSSLQASAEATGLSEEQARLSRLLFVASMKVGMGTERLIELVETLQKTELGVEDRALKVREGFGDVLPEGLLGEEEERVYLRLYGEPIVRMREVDLERFEEELVGDLRAEAEAEGEELEEGTGVFVREGEEGEEVEVEFEDEEGAGEEEIVDMDDVDTRLADDMRIAMEREEEFGEEDEDGESTLRAHPLTTEGRFSTSPSSVQLPKSTFVQPIEVLLSGTPSVHIKDAAHRIFGGIGLPNSTSTPNLAKTMQQRPIPIDASQGRMTEIDANTFLAVLMPAMYSTVMSALVESRKRLGTAWAEGLVRKAEAGELKILDAGGAGAGVLAVREMLRAEWERMHEDDVDGISGLGVAEADGKLGGPNLSPPLGNATVLTGSDTLRQRSSALLDNTTFIPRLPDYAHTEVAKQTGKFDIVIAPHTLFPIREDWARKNHVDNLWSLVSIEGGLLVVLEKGIARGFEAVALAREHLLKNHIADPTVETTSQDIDEPDITWEEPTKDTGMIVAPCTNHTDCPMYSGKNKGVIKGRKDICHFQQRYTRPPFLQKILGAKDKNFEDLKFSYVSLMRGRDLRTPTLNNTEDASSSPFAALPIALQGDAATDRAFIGYDTTPDADETNPTNDPPPPPPSTLSLPRQILQPLKRRGHVILDLCTPAGSLERWTVPRSFGKQAFRDARKSSWGDLWALGAKTRVIRTARVGDKKRERRAEKEMEGEEGEGKPERKALSKRLAKEKRRVKERKAGRKGVLLGREVDFVNGD